MSHYVAAYPPGRDIAPCLPTKTDELRRDPLEVRKAMLASRSPLGLTADGRSHHQR